MHLDTCICSIDITKIQVSIGGATSSIPNTATAELKYALWIMLSFVPWNRITIPLLRLEIHLHTISVEVAVVFITQIKDQSGYKFASGAQFPPQLVICIWIHSNFCIFRGCEIHNVS